ncbi:MAG: glycosyltransferase family 4 protein [Ferruginibacter sp.]
MAGEKSIVFINQNAGYLMIDIIHAYKDYGQKAIITGKLVERQIPLDKSVKFNKIITYNRTSTIKRLFTWVCGFIQIVWIVKTRYKKADLFIVTNPPFNTFLPFVCKNRFAVLVYDVYPDALISYNILKENSFIARFWKKANRKVYAKAQRIFTIGDTMKTILSNYADAAKIEVVPLWTDNNFLKPVPKEDNIFIKENGLTGKFIVMYSGNLGRTHSVEVLVEAASLIQDDDIMFVIVGEGEKKQLITEMVNDRNLKNVRLLPWQEPAVLPFSLSAADLGVVTIDAVAGNLSVPSKTFNLLSVGVPLVCIAGGDADLAKLVDKYSVGKCFLKNEAASIVDYIKKLKADKNYQYKLRENALQASMDFTPENALKFAEAKIS